VFETAGIVDRLTELRAVMAKDDTHYLEIGYKNIANRCRNCIQQIMAESKSVTKKNFTSGGVSKAHAARQHHD
jgi:hypothetical protein